jgi:ABC-type multidrug transport system fused ATPase/permease subunit
MYTGIFVMSSFSSVERIHEYVVYDKHEKEWTRSIAEIKQKGNNSNYSDETWPNEGRIISKQMKIRYRPGLPLVLKDVNFDLKPG